MHLKYEVLDVFTDRPFGGNQFAVVYGAEQLSAERMQRIAAEFGFAESTFVLSPADANCDARVRIFTPTAELPFAGHPNVGTAVSAARRGELFGRPVGEHLRFEKLAGVVPVQLLLDAAGQPTGAMPSTPTPYSVVEAVTPQAAAACLDLQVADLRLDRHGPLVATTGLPYLLIELKSKDALGRSRGVSAACAAIGATRLHAYVRTPGDGDGIDIRCRMHWADGSEDAGTGSANSVLLGLLASLEGAGGRERLALHIAQGDEMGRPSRLVGEAACLAGEIKVGGACVALMRGDLML